MRYRKITSTAAAVLTALSLLGPFTSCQKQVESSNYNETLPKDTSYSYSETIKDEEVEQDKQTEQDKQDKKEIKTLDEINPIFSVYRYQGEDYITIDEKSVLEISRIVMQDVKEFLLEHGAYNMKYDENGNRLLGDKNFYANWQDEYFAMARAFSESSFMINYVADGGAAGIMQLKMDGKDGVRNTLQYNFKNVFGVTVDFSDIEVIPSQETIDKIFYSKDAQRDAVQIVYNSILMSTHYSLYIARSYGANHPDYYAKYGGYKEKYRKDFIIYVYANNWNDTHNDLVSGQFYEKHSDDTYLNNVNKYQLEFGRKYEGKDYNPDKISSSNEQQPQM